MGQPARPAHEGRPSPHQPAPARPHPRPIAPAGATLALRRNRLPHARTRERRAAKEQSAARHPSPEPFTDVTAAIHSSDCADLRHDGALPTVLAKLPVGLGQVSAKFLALLLSTRSG